MLRQMQETVNSATIKLITLNKTLSDLIKLEESPSGNTMVDEALAQVLYTKMSLVFQNLSDDLGDMGDLLIRMFNCDEDEDE